MAPLGDRLLVKPKQAEQVRPTTATARAPPPAPAPRAPAPEPPHPLLQTTSGGLVLPTSATKSAMGDAIIGTVVAVGEDCELGLAAGDQVLFTKYGSTEVEVPDGQVCFVAEKSIMAKLA
jgi:chaperonin GroES